VGRFILLAWVYSVFAVWTPQYIGAILPNELQRMFGDFTYNYAGDFIAPFEFYFFSGLLCGWIYKRFNLTNPVSLMVIAAGIIGLWRYWKILDGGHGFGSPPDAPFTGLFFGCIILGFAALERSGSLKLGLKARRLGMLSYPLYILHDPIMAIVNNQFGSVLRIGPVALWIFSIVLFCMVYLVCTMITFFIDQPLQKLLRRIDLGFVSRLWSA
jgi:peptidoglycan/LPS O-acetylase OafA/YrhL